MEQLIIETAVILGMTSVIGKLVPRTWRDRVLPACAMLIGVLAVYGVEAVGGVLTFALAFKGVILGGTVTGLYATAKDMKKTPNIVANV
jgi:hypothetical protein